MCIKSYLSTFMHSMCTSSQTPSYILTNHIKAFLNSPVRQTFAAEVRRQHVLVQVYQGGHAALCKQAHGVCSRRQISGVGNTGRARRRQGAHKQHAEAHYAYYNPKPCIIGRGSNAVEKFFCMNRSTYLKVFFNQSK